MVFDWNNTASIQGWLVPYAILIGKSSHIMLQDCDTSMMTAHYSKSQYNYSNYELTVFRPKIIHPLTPHKRSIQSNCTVDPVDSGAT